MDLVAALKAPFSGEGWVKKLIIVGLLFLVPIVNFATMGYFVKYLKNVLNGEEKTPEFSDFGGLFVTGLKVFLGSILLFIPFILLCFVIGMLFAKAENIASLIVYVLYFVYYFVAYVLLARFAMDEKILSMVDFASAIKLISGNKNILMFILFLFALGLVYGIVTTVCCVTLVGIILVPFLIFAAMISNFNLIGQFVKGSPNFEEVKSSAK